MMRLRAPICVAAVLLTLTACGGGGGGGGVSNPPLTQSTAGPTAAPAGASAQVTFRIATSSIATASSTRSPKYVSPSTQSVSASLQVGSQLTLLGTVNVTPSACLSGTCTITANAPIGSDTFVIATYDGLNGTGNQLSNGTTTVTVAQNATNSVSLTLNGVIASSTVILGSTSVQAGTSATVSVTVAGYDAQHNLIVGPGNYSTPVHLANSDATGVTTLSSSTIAAPGATVQLVYNGGSTTGATITPSVGGVAGTPATFAPTGYGFAIYPLTGSTSAYIDSMTTAAGNVWYMQSGTIGYITPAGSATAFTNGVPTGDYYTLGTASNGLLWFGDNNGDLASVTTGGTVTPLATVTIVNGCSQGGNNNDESVARRRAQSEQQSATLCGPVYAMALGPDGNLWFSDYSGSIGNITPAGVATEWNVAALPGWSGPTSATPGQIAFDAAGNLYANEAGGLIDRFTIAGGAPQSVTYLGGGLCTESGSFALAIDANNTIWAADYCANLYELPLGNPVQSTNFAASNVQSYSISSISNNNGLAFMLAGGGSVWAVDDDTNLVYRISSVPGTNPPVPTISTFAQLTSSFETGELVIGTDTNLWVSYSNETAGNFVGKVAFGVPPASTAMTELRSLPAATRTASRNAAALRRHKR